MTVRRMVVVRSPGTDRRPEIRISNTWLLLAGFVVGTPIEVFYNRGVITIRTIREHEQRNIQKVSVTVPDENAAGPRDAEKSIGH